MCQPCPFSATYGATKAFISTFAASLAPEVKSRGIDVCAIHPSPVATRFYENQKAIDSLDFFKIFAVEADALPDAIFASIGRSVWRDVGGVAVGFRCLMKAFDYNTFALMTAAFAHTMGDYKRHVPKD